MICRLAELIFSAMSFVLLLAIGAVSTACAQTSASAAKVNKVAISGEPFGVFSVDVPMIPGAGEDIPRVRITDSEGRVFYPAIGVLTQEVVKGPFGNDPNQAPVRRPGARIRRRPGGLLDRIGNAIRETAPRETVPVAYRVTGLFKGNRSFTLTLSGEISQQIAFTPQPQNSARHRETLEAWWGTYTGAAKQEISGKDSPKLIQRYLCSMLARRLDLPAVNLSSTKEGETEQESKPLETLALLGGIESLRDEILDDVLNNPGAGAASLTAPRPPNWMPTTELPIAPNVEVETLASRVPPECFYLRFGAFSNFVWFQEIAQRYGGDIAQAVLVRGFSYDATARLERQLAAKMTSLAKMFGDSLIGDLAVVGTDLYLAEGASLGVIFQARNPALLAAAIEADRKAAAEKRGDASVQTLDIAGKEVILLSTPDNQLRSFFVIDGNYVFVTTSRRLVERFIEVGAGAPSLAQMSNFRSVRSWMPNSNDYSVFAYFSPEFFQHLVSPRYQIELRRRLEAIAHLESAELAQLVAQSEGYPSAEIHSYKTAGLLPTWFDERADGAQVLRYDGKLIDSTRGARGSFLPINDVVLKGVNARESKVYQETSEFYQDSWKNMDPIVIGLRRFQSPDNNAETVAFEGYMAPFGAEKYGWIGKQLGAPTNAAISLPVDDLANLQLHIRESPLLQNSDYHLFAGVKDMYLPDDAKGFFEVLSALQNSKAYIGAWPKPGFVDRIPLGILQSLSEPDVLGFSRMVGGLWRWQDRGFSLLSFSKPILDAAIPQLDLVQADDAAQARLLVQNLQGTEMARWIDDLWYRRGLEASKGNARLLDTIQEQLHVPATECLSVAEQVLDVRLQCPIGGEYNLQPDGSGGGMGWHSSAWKSVNQNASGKPTAPVDYSAPWVGWFRGGRLHATQMPQSLALVGTLEMEMEPLPIDLTDSLPTSLPSMNFDIFSLPGKLFGSGSKSSPDRQKF